MKYYGKCPKPSTTLIFLYSNEMLVIRAGIYIIVPVKIFYDFTNLTQVHNFTVNAQDIFTFGRLSSFTVSFTEI